MRVPHVVGQNEGGGASIGAIEAPLSDEDGVEEPLQQQKRSEDDTGPITIDGVMPQKRFYRARAHVNPLSHNDCFE